MHISIHSCCLRWAVTAADIHLPANSRCSLIPEFHLGYISIHVFDVGICRHSSHAPHCIEPEPPTWGRERALTTGCYIHCKGKNLLVYNSFVGLAYKTQNTQWKANIFSLWSHLCLIIEMWKRYLPFSWVAFTFFLHLKDSEHQTILNITQR